MHYCPYFDGYGGTNFSSRSGLSYTFPLMSRLSSNDTPILHPLSFSLPQEIFPFISSYTEPPRPRRSLRSAFLFDHQSRSPLPSPSVSRTNRKLHLHPLLPRLPPRRSPKRWPKKPRRRPAMCLHRCPPPLRLSQHLYSRRDSKTLSFPPVSSRRPPSLGLVLVLMMLPMVLLSANSHALSDLDRLLMTGITGQPTRHLAVSPNLYLSCAPAPVPTSLSAATTARRPFLICTTTAPPVTMATSIFARHVSTKECPAIAAITG